MQCELHLPFALFSGRFTDLLVPVWNLGGKTEKTAKETTNIGRGIAKKDRGQVGIKNARSRYETTSIQIHLPKLLRGHLKRHIEPCPSQLKSAINFPIQFNSIDQINLI
eukprot:COSAG04_NODE_414_length_14737_cov_79.200779_8_plen_109_part_00